MMYTSKRITEVDLSPTVINFICSAAVELNQSHGNFYKWENFQIRDFVKKNYLIFCYRDEKPVGFLAASIFKSFFDGECVILKQNLLFSLPNTRASYLLLKEFVDFGKANANHIITMIGPKTNIKPSSLEKLGFKKLEELYRMET